MYTLYKHPAAVLTYTFDFGAQDGYVGPLGTVWPCDPLRAGEALQAGDVGPAGLLLLLQQTAGIGLSVFRADGEASDLAVLFVAASESQVYATLGGGSDGTDYVLTVIGSTNQGEARVGLGRLTVTRRLPPLR